MTLFKVGEQYPPVASVERLSRYERMRTLFNGNPLEVYDRATEILKDSPHEAQLRKLYIAVNLADILATKPADLLVGDPPNYESGADDESAEQQALNQYVEENDLNQLIHESATANGYRGDAWIKARFGYVQDFTELTRLGLDMPDDVLMEPIIDHVDASTVFPETSNGNVKRFKAINIATVEYLTEGTDEIPYLKVERHLPGYIVYERYKMRESNVVTDDGVNLQLYSVDSKVATGREQDVVKTGIPEILIKHMPYKAKDSQWQGVGNIEKVESVLRAINDRLVQIDYILWKHSDPHMYGPDITDDDGAQRLGGGIYVPVTPDDTTPGYLTWNSQLEGAFKQLDYLLSVVFQMTETPQWLFGTTITQDKGGTGTSHSDGRAIQMRLLPILSKVNRIKIYTERAFQDVLYAVQRLELYANEGVEGFEVYTAQYPKIVWNSPIPRDRKEEAEIANLRTGGKPTLDVHSAIKRLDGFDDEEATKIITRIDEDDDRVEGFVDASIFNAETGIDDDE